MQKQKMIAEQLAELPVAAQIEEIDFDAQNIIALAETGSGKTMVLAAVEALIRKERGEEFRIFMRQPTKQATYGVYRGLKKFWEPLGLEIGISTKDLKENLDDADIVVFSDGSLTNLIQKTQYTPIVYFDEVHSMGLISTEIEIALCKLKGIKMRLLTATIDPQPLVTYLGDVKLYTLSGRTYPIEKHIIVVDHEEFNKPGEDEFQSRIREIVNDVYYADDRAIVFLPTKQLCEDYAEMFQEDVDCKFVHGEVSPVELEDWVEEREDDPFVIFATLALATSITIDVGRVYIYNQRVDSEVKAGIERQFKCEPDNNLILQMAGRCGRLREGNAYLIASDKHMRRSWDEVHPVPITTPAAKSTPYEVILNMASYGVGNTDEIDLLSDIDEREMQGARRWLHGQKFIKDDGTLTRDGWRILRMTPPPHLSMLILSRHDEAFQHAMLASVIMQMKGTYYLPKNKVNSRGLQAARFNAAKRIRDEGGMVSDLRDAYPILPYECLSPGNMPLTLARILQRAYQAQDRNNKKETLPQWCNANNVSIKQIRFAMKDFEEGLRAFEGDVKTFREVDLTNPELEREFRTVINAMTRKHESFVWAGFNTGHWSRIKVKDHHPDTGELVDMDLGAVVCGTTKDLMKIDDPGYEAVGIARLITSNGGNTFASIEWPILKV